MQKIKLIESTMIQAIECGSIPFNHKIQSKSNQ